MCKKRSRGGGVRGDISKFQENVSYTVAVEGAHLYKKLATPKKQRSACLNR